jgi:hypothetical protein
MTAHLKSAVRPISSGARPGPQGAPGWGLIEWFLIGQIALPALLYLPGTHAFRVPLRIAPYGLSVLALLWWMHRQPAKRLSPHPACPWLIAVLVCLGVMVFHPTTNSYVAGLAQMMLYLSVLAPVFWTPALVRNAAHLERLLTILLICNGINALVGVLQVYDPDRWLPEQLSEVITRSYDLNSLRYRGPNGVSILRPPGLSDNPGAVCAPGAVAALLGLSFTTAAGPIWKRGVGLAFGVIGVMAVWLSFVRTSLLILGGSLTVYAMLLAFQKRWNRTIVFVVLAGSVALCSYSLSLTLGGESIAERFETLVEEDPISVYYASGRAGWLTHGFSYYLAEYPLGAGLGRWGMMRHYFGDPTNAQSSAIFAELQFIAWILDGGFLLPALYCCALIVTGIHEIRIVKLGQRHRGGSWLAAAATINAGTLALVFGFTPFTTQTGLQYWFLAGALHAVAASFGCHPAASGAGSDLSGTPTALAPGARADEAPTCAPMS